MKLLDEHLGKAISAEDVAAYIGCDVKTVRKHYRELGGMRLGRHYLFFERSIIDAVSERTKMDCPSAKRGEEAGEGLLDKEGGAVVGSQNAAKALKRLERQDRHGLYR